MGTHNYQSVVHVHVGACTSTVIDVGGMVLSCKLRDMVEGHGNRDACMPPRQPSPAWTARGMGTRSPRCCWPDGHGMALR